MVTQKRIDEAKEYVDYGIREGFFSPEDWELLTDQEFVTKAERCRYLGYLYADAMEKESL